MLGVSPEEQEVTSLCFGGGFREGAGDLDGAVCTGQDAVGGSRPGWGVERERAPLVSLLVCRQEKVEPQRERAGQGTPAEREELPQ